MLSKIQIYLLILGVILINIGFVASQASISLSVDAYPKEGIVSAGDKVLLQINLIQLLNRERKDVVVAISLVDDKNEIVDRSTETIALETKASFISRLNIPKDAKEGDYTIKIEVFDVTGENLLGIASKDITLENGITTEDIYKIGIYLTVAFLIVLILMIYKHNRDFHKGHKLKLTKKNI